MVVTYHRRTRPQLSGVSVPLSASGVPNDRLGKGASGLPHLEAVAKARAFSRAMQYKAPESTDVRSEKLKVPAALYSLNRRASDSDSSVQSMGTPPLSSDDEASTASTPRSISTPRGDDMPLMPEPFVSWTDGGSSGPMSTVIICVETGSSREHTFSVPLCALLRTPSRLEDIARGTLRGSTPPSSQRNSAAVADKRNVSMGMHRSTSTDSFVTAREDSDDDEPAQHPYAAAATARPASRPTSAKNARPRPANVFGTLRLRSIRPSVMANLVAYFLNGSLPPAVEEMRRLVEFFGIDTLTCEIGAPLVRYERRAFDELWEAKIGALDTKSFAPTKVTSGFRF